MLDITWRQKAISYIKEYTMVEGIVMTLKNMKWTSKLYHIRN